MCFTLAALAFIIPTAATLLPCPTTRWDASGVIKHLPPRSTNFLQQVPAPNVASEAAEYTWLQQQADGCMETLSSAGALYFQGFALPTTKPGFRRFCEALGLKPCADPLASIGVRSLLSPDNGVYEAVNAESLSKTFIGVHNDVTYKLAAPFGAFVCFQRAASGGTFLLADGRAVLADISPRVLTNLRERKLSVRVAALPTGNLRYAGPLAPCLAGMLEAAVSLLLRVAIPLELELAWSRSGDILQILERAKPPINRHPATGEASFFSSIHSQSRYLQKRRAATSFEGIAATDVFYGDLDSIEHEVLDHIEEVVQRHMRRIEMEPGEVILLDSYQVLHGRDTFDGPHEHGVMWLTNDFFSSETQEQREGGFSSDIINWLAVKR